MSDKERAELAYENEVNSAYLARLEHAPKYRIAGVNTSTQGEWGPLLGRVGLEDDPRDAREFYVGPRAVDEIQGVRVVSWVAPAAEAFFKPLRDWQGQRIRVRRHFKPGASRIDGYWDEWVARPTAPAFSLGSRRTLNRPGVPSGPLPASGSGARNKNGSVASPDLSDRRLTPVPDPAELPLATSADDYLVHVLRAPRTGQLQHVLSTLRPDQYEAITHPELSNLIVEGHPGTGKSVVATHRAAWLADPSRAPRPTGTVLLTGPSVRWTNHVRGVTDGLAAHGGVRVASLPEIVSRLLGTPVVDAPYDSSFEAVSDGTGRTLGQFVIHLRRTTGVGDLASTFNLLRKVDWTRTGVMATPEFLAWRAALPEYGVAVGSPKFWPALAWMSALIKSMDPVDHVIVDEAQDVRPIEWMFLKRLRPKAWTLVGDMNQRRTEHACRTWEEITTLLGGQWSEPTYFENGYRSTQAIIDFAAPLLSNGQRRSTAALGQGDLPRVYSVSQEATGLHRLALRAVRELAAKFPLGSIAVIHPRPPGLVAEARGSGWQEVERNSWKSPSGGARSESTPASFTVLTPAEARGVEFDCVVIVEPAEFPKTTIVGHGPLYTAITRANRDLIVVHEKPLPHALTRKHPPGFPYRPAAPGMLLDPFGTASVHQKPPRHEARLTAIAVESERKVAYTADFANNTISVVLLGSRKLVRTLRPPCTPFFVAVDPSHDLIYVADVEGDQVHVMRTQTGDRAFTLKVGRRPSALAVDPSSGRLYVACFGSDTVQVFDTATRRHLDDFRIGSPRGLALDKATSLLYVLQGSGEIRTYDPETKCLAHSRYGAAGGTSLAVDGARSRLYLALEGQRISIRSLKSNRTLTIQTTFASHGIAVNDRDGTVYAVDPQQDAVLTVETDEKLVDPEEGPRRAPQPRQRQPEDSTQPPAGPRRTVAKTTPPEARRGTITGRATQKPKRRGRKRPPDSR